MRLAAMSTDESQGRSAARPSSTRKARAALLSFALACGTALAQTPAAAPSPVGAATPAAPTTGATDGDPATALARYVAKPDPTFAWELRTHYRVKGADAIELLMQSQTWQGVAWKHQVVLIKPRGLTKPDHALVIVGGGRWKDSFAEPSAGEEDLPSGGDVFVGLARLLHTVVVVIGQVPYQPLFGLSEDRLIAYTFDQYERTGDQEWPLLLPMVKSVVRALDASDAAARREWQQPLATFTLTGASKRGWTTWLTPAVEPRVTAFAPIVMDALNMAQHFPHQTAVFGAPSEAIKPYTDLGLPEILSSDRGAPLRSIVDPYNYRAALTQPKLIIIATNDAYFPFDSLNLYWDALEGPKYALYLPNEPHGIKHFNQAFRALRALHDSASGGTPLPKIEWEFAWNGDGGTLCVRSDPRPRAVRVWSTTSEGRDFRSAAWTAGPEISAHAAQSIALAPPSSGYVATFAEVEYGRWLTAFSLSTNLAVLPAPGTQELGPRPRGVPGICSADASRSR